MAQIGTFILKDDVWTGTIRTLTLNVRARLVPGRDRTKDAPEFRLYAGGAQAGAAWRQAPRDGGASWLAVRLDDPSFAQPIRAAFFESPGEAKGVLVWNRANRPDKVS